MAFTSGVPHNSCGTFVAGQSKAGTELGLNKNGIYFEGIKEVKGP